MNAPSAPRLDPDPTNWALEDIIEGLRQVASVGPDPDEPADAFDEIHALLIEAARRLELFGEVFAEVAGELHQ